MLRNMRLLHELGTPRTQTASCLKYQRIRHSGKSTFVQDSYMKTSKPKEHTATVNHSMLIYFALEFSCAAAERNSRFIHSQQWDAATFRTAIAFIDKCLAVGAAKGTREPNTSPSDTMYWMCHKSGPTHNVGVLTRSMCAPFKPIKTHRRFRQSKTTALLVVWSHCMQRQFSLEDARLHMLSRRKPWLSNGVK